MARRRQISFEQRLKEIDWLEAQLTKAGINKKQLADEMGLENSGNVSLWCLKSPKGSPIPDLDLLWLGRRFKQDVFALRSSLNDYAIYFEGDSFLAELSPASRKQVIANAEHLRSIEAPKPANQFQYETSTAKPARTPARKK